jgi:flagellar hook-associated protein 2
VCGEWGQVSTTGKITATSSLTDSTTVKSLNYAAGTSDISSLSQLGITVNSDGSLTLDATSLDSSLNSDFSSVVGFFQDANSWGGHLSTVLEQAGTSSSTGILKLAERSNSTIEENLRAYVSREESLISSEQKSLMAELTSANEVLQAIPTQLNSINEIYSAVTGYNTTKS